MAGFAVVRTGSVGFEAYEGAATEGQIHRKSLFVTTRNLSPHVNHFQKTYSRVRKRLHDGT
jgi:hypothetical protein